MFKPACRTEHQMCWDWCRTIGAPICADPFLGFGCGPQRTPTKPGHTQSSGLNPPCPQQMPLTGQQLLQPKLSHNQSYLWTVIDPDQEGGKLWEMLEYILTSLHNHPSFWDRILRFCYGAWIHISFHGVSNFGSDDQPFHHAFLLWAWRKHLLTHLRGDGAESSSWQLLRGNPMLVCFVYSSTLKKWSTNFGITLADYWKNWCFETCFSLGLEPGAVALFLLQWCDP